MGRHPCPLAPTGRAMASAGRLLLLLLCLLPVAPVLTIKKYQHLSHKVSTTSLSLQGPGLTLARPTPGHPGSQPPFLPGALCFFSCPTPTLN